MSETMIQRTAAAPRIAYDDRGQGEPARLFLTGWCSDYTQVSPTARLCAERRRVLVVDWRGHGRSERPASDFGFEELVDDAVAVIAASGARRVVPVAQAHGGWVAVELRRRLVERIPRLVHTSWLVLEPPPAFLAAWAAMQDPTRWREGRDSAFSTWLEGVTHPGVIQFVHEVMGSHGFEMWARTGREISAVYARYGSPIKALATLDPPVPTLHLYGQPRDGGWLAAQETFAADHSWFHVRRLDVRSHFPTIEAPTEVADAIESFVANDQPIADTASA
jgi:pimeloyl-ACP methyl ester carboxylesterase